MIPVSITSPTLIQGNSFMLLNTEFRINTVLSQIDLYAATSGNVTIQVNIF